MTPCPLSPVIVPIPVMTPCPIPGPVQCVWASLEEANWLDKIKSISCVDTDWKQKIDRKLINIYKTCSE